MDYVFLEGFEVEKTLPKIIAAKTAEEAKCYLDSSTIAISGIITQSEKQTQTVSNLNVPTINSVFAIKELADLVEQKALSGLL